jgi:zinc transport system substrate-binding protein
MRTLVAVSVAVALVAAGGCGSSSSSGASKHGDGRLDVVASFYPLAEAAAMVGGGDVSVTNLTPPGTEPHDIELTTRQVDRIHDADVVVYLGRGFQSAVERAVGRRDGNGDGNGAVDGLQAVDRAKLSGRDPHVWLDPSMMTDIASAVTDALAKAEPAKADAFRGRFRSYRQSLADLLQEMQAGLAHCDRKVIVTAHEAFHYLAERFGLRQEAIAGLSPDAEPPADRLAALADDIERTGATTVFTEALVSPKVADALAREAHVTTAVLDPLEGLTKAKQASGASYVTVMRENLATLRTALGCR